MTPVDRFKTAVVVASRILTKEQQLNRQLTEQELKEINTTVILEREEADDYELELLTRITANDKLTETLRTFNLVKAYEKNTVVKSSIQGFHRLLNKQASILHKQLNDSIW